jgi:hypothetical protein
MGANNTALHQATPKSHSLITRAWVTDPSITKLSETFLTNLHQDQQKLKEAGEDIAKATKYNAPTSDSIV